MPKGTLSSTSGIKSRKRYFSPSQARERRTNIAGDLANPF
jgi:hypothetical protein